MLSSKPIFRVRNWSEYNQILKDRWSLEIWFSPAVCKKWYSHTSNGKKGADLTYSREAILTCLTIRCLFNLSLRATEGFIQSFLKRLGLNSLKCPSYSQLCRRSGSLRIKIPRRGKEHQAFYMAVDTTGLKVYGEGEWHVKMHKASKRRTWKKLHIAIDPVTQELLDAELTDSKVGDSTFLPKMLSKIKDPIKKLWADGAYDCSPVYKDLDEKGIYPIIPPQQNAQPSYSYYTRRRLGKRRLVMTKPWMRPRDLAIHFIQQFTNPKEGKAVWKKSIGFGLRSLVESAIMRFKRTFTDKLRSRKLINQKGEARLKASILNKMLHVGIPYTVPIAN
jgi:hypothetical protein